MSRIIKIAKAIRRNWKKSVVGFSALAWGVSYGIDKYKTFQLMRAYCEEAKKYGDLSQPQLKKPRHVTVILNPVAHNRKAKSQYEKYAAPLLHLAGLKVSIIQTESEGQAKDLMEIMSNTDAVIIAGGNGTLHEAVTGLLGRPEYEENVTSDMPMGIIPVGKTNAVSKMLFSTKTANTAQVYGQGCLPNTLRFGSEMWLAESAMAVIRESTISLDVMKIEAENEKPLYALWSFEIGSFPDVETTISKYWYFGAMKAQAAYLFRSLKKTLCIDGTSVDYLPACEGCSRCYMQPSNKKKDIRPKRWWDSFVPKPPVRIPEKDYSKVINENCGIWCTEKKPFSNLIISTNLWKFCNTSSSSKGMWINWIPSDISIKQFITSGLAYHSVQPLDELKTAAEISAKEVVLNLTEETEEGNTQTCYIDTAKYDMKKVHLSLLPKHLIVYA